MSKGANDSSIYNKDSMLPCPLCEHWNYERSGIIDSIMKASEIILNSINKKEVDVVGTEEFKRIQNIITKAIEESLSKD